MSEEASAFGALIEVAELSRKHAKGLPAQVDVKQQWTGIGFSIFGNNYVAPMSEVVEMLEMPSFTRLPGVMAWIKGVANVRGRLLPLTDMAVFLGGKLTSPWRQQRVLVVELDDLYGGLVVDQVYGMQHFEADSYSQEIKGGTVSDLMIPYMQGSFTSNTGDEWAVFSPWMLVKSEQFFQSALQAS